MIPADFVIFEIPADWTRQAGGIEWLWHLDDHYNSDGICDDRDLRVRLCQQVCVYCNYTPTSESGA